MRQVQEYEDGTLDLADMRSEVSMYSSQSSNAPLFNDLIKQEMISEGLEEKVIWPGLQSLYLGLTQNRGDIEWYIGWYFIYRVAILLPLVYL